MKIRNLKNTFNNYTTPWIILTVLLLSFNAGAFQQTGSLERLVNACQEELKTICGRLNEPNEALVCLRENEPRLQTKECVSEVRSYERETNNAPLLNQEPFRDPSTNDIL